MGQQALEVTCKRHTRMWDGVGGGEKAGGDQGMACGWRRITESSGMARPSSSRALTRERKVAPIWGVARETLTQRRGEQF
jgi:hypothetical protein